MTRQGLSLERSFSTTSNNAVMHWPDVSPIPHDDSFLVGDANVDETDLCATISMPTEMGVSQSPPPPPSDLPSRSVPDHKSTVTVQKSKVKSAVLKVPPMPRYDVAVLLQQSWRKAIRVLRANPELMTRTILCLALRQRPPAYIVQWMLRLNPSAASAPDQGPTPLFVAVEEKCSTAVVEVVLEANPLALVARPAGSRYDPLAFAQRERRQESDLLALLRRPVSYWFPHARSPPRTADETGHSQEESPLGIQRRYTSTSNKTSRCLPTTPDATEPGCSPRTTDDSGQIIDESPLGIQGRSTGRKKTLIVANDNIEVVDCSPGRSHKGKVLRAAGSFTSPATLGIEKMPRPVSPEKTPKIAAPPPPPPPRRQQIPALLHRTRPLATTPERPRPMPKTSPSSSAWTSAERQELDNIKYLCLALLKAHRRMLKTQAESSSSSPSTPSSLAHDTTISRSLLTESERQELLRTMEKRQDEQARICLIALDMKERAITAMARRMQERLESSELQVSERNLRSSYVHLYRRIMGLEEEFQTLRRASLSVVHSPCLSANNDSSRAVFDPPGSEQRPTQVVAANDLPGNEGVDEVQSLLSEEALGERNRSCLRPPWAYFRSRNK